ncbi:MAG: hypothetical protein J0L96_20555 [Anaerolineae bacterium]|nr:hypothetical protein [Anaerolineae bacterium]
MKKVYSSILIAIVCLVASLITVAGQFNYIYTYYGRDYIMTRDFRNHRSIVLGNADAPYRYRVLSNWALQVVFDFTNPATPHYWTDEYRSLYEKTALSFRVAQNFLIFLLAIKYFETLGFSYSTRFVGVALLSLSMGFAFYQSNLSFYTYTEIALLLLSGIIINLKKDWWILFATVISALNREGAIFIPVMLFAARLSEFEWSAILKAKISAYKWLVPPILATLLFLVFSVGIRYFLGQASAYSESRYGNVYPGIELFYLNIMNRNTWIGLAQMYGVLFVTLILVKYWTNILKMYLLFLAIPWFLVVFIFGSADETRLFLVPLVIVFIPAALHLTESYRTLK